MYEILVRTLFFSDCNGSLISVFAQNYELLDTWIVSEILSSLPFLGADGGVGGEGRSWGLWRVRTDSLLLSFNYYLLSS